MKLHGTTESNLIAAIDSVRRLRGQRVHADTMKHWTDLLQHGRDQLVSTSAFMSIELTQLVGQLALELGAMKR